MADKNMNLLDNLSKEDLIHTVYHLGEYILRYGKCETKYQYPDGTEYDCGQCTYCLLKKEFNHEDNNEQH